MLMRESVHRRFLLAVSFGSLFFALIVGFISFIYEYHSELGRARQLQDELVATVRSSASVAAFASNKDIASEIENGLLANPIINGVSLVSKNGFTHSRVRKSGQSNGDALVSYPLYSPMAQQDNIGELRLSQDAGEIDRRAIRSALRYALVLILQIPVFAGLSMFAFGRLVSRPLAHVAHALEGASPGSSQRIEMPDGQADNEIGQLVNSSNVLLHATEQAILDERRLQAEVNQLQMNYRRIFETTNVGVMIMKPDGCLVDCNPTLLSRIVGIQFDPTGAAPCGNFIDAIFKRPQLAWAMVHEAQSIGQSVAGDLQLVRADGQENWVHCILSVVTDSTGVVEFVEGVLYDVTARRARESEARKVAEMDLLTGLSTRRGLEFFLDRALRRAREDGVNIGVMLLDLDGFKAVNDQFGHAAGDHVLKVVSDRLSERIRRSSDLIARLGGDEFVIVIHDCDSASDTLDTIANNIINMICQPIELDGGVNASVGTSIGIARFPENGNSRAELLEAADVAMYEVKRNGKNNYALSRRTAAPSAGVG
jgi:diguanylate cyclase (GGDEF)-like protein